MKLPRTLRQTLTIARRDFVATVFTPTFLIFLLAPLIMASFGAVGGLGAATMADSGEDTMRIAIVAPPAQTESLQAADKQLRTLFRRSDDKPPPLLVEPPSGDEAKQARAMFDRADMEVTAVMYGGLDRPQILYAPRGSGAAGYLAQIAEQTLRAQRAGTDAPLSTASRTVVTRAAVTASGKGHVAFFGVFGLFFLTLMLSGQVVGTMAEERSNKVIEVLAAAVPLESVFLGKLIGMFGVAILFLLFWGMVVANLSQLMPPQIARAFSDLGPAVGYPAYPLLFLAYFATAYLLLGAVFLTVGAQASTQRELQMLSLPITIFQMAMFGLSAAAASAPAGWVATAAEVFPFSSPFAMIARAANSPELWRHWLALAWQALWVAVVIGIGTRWFRRGVLKSGSPKMRFGRRKAAA